MIAVVFGILARGWALTLEGGKVGKETAVRERKEIIAMAEPDGEWVSL